MRVLELDSGREMRGGQWQALFLLDGLEDAVLMARPGSPLFDAARAKGLHVLPWRPITVALGRWDLIHAHDARSHTLAALAAHCPVIVSRRVAFPVRTNALSRWKYARAAHFLAVSRHVAAQLGRAGVPDAKITVVPDGVPIPPCQSTLDGEIIAPATEDPMKGSDLVRQAAALGGFQVRFSRDLEVDLRSARLFLYITRDEGLGSAALAAMAAGVPVVASRAGGLPEAVEDGETGLLAENTPEAIARAVRELLGDGPAAARMGAAGRLRAEQFFTVDRMIRDTLQVYHRILSC
jgi:glycosyltransferase involved in cell wall biosynthesis